MQENLNLTAGLSTASNEIQKQTNQYIFGENEFEGESFHAAAFVAKYRRVTTLESLRDQLRGYVKDLKTQVIQISNC